MKFYTPILFLLFAGRSFGQDIVFDTSANRLPVTGFRYYAKTNFSQIDTLQLWNYSLDTTYRTKATDSVKVLGQLIFWRTKPIDDSISKRLYHQPWTPYMTFFIFSIKDTSFCYAQSKKTRYFSSCVPPEVGGDIIIIDKFVFLNSSVCVNCQPYGKEVDYCRPVINYVFSNLDRAKITTIQSLVHQFLIAEGKIPKHEEKKITGSD